MPKVVGAFCAVVVALLLAPAPAHAHTQRTLTVAFTGIVSLDDDWDCTAGCTGGEMWAPVSQAPECTPLCPEPPGEQVLWVLGTAADPDGGVGCTAVTDHGVEACTITAQGEFRQGSDTFLGPYCGLPHQGTVDLTVTMGDQAIRLVGPPAAVFHAHPVMTWQVSDGVVATTDAGVADLALLVPDEPCGLEGPGFDPATSFTAAGTVTWAKPLPL